MSNSRILLKLSGEALQGANTHGIDPDIVAKYVAEIADLVRGGITLGIVIGGGNYFRGLQGQSSVLDRATGDRMGMLATVMNGLTLESALHTAGLKARHFTAMTIEGAGNRFNSTEVLRALDDQYITVFSGGTGNPYFTTDTAAVLRALEIKADVLLKGTRVDGIYSADPEKHPDAVKYDRLTFDEAWEQGLKIMDLTAFSLCKENNLPVIVFNMNKPGNLVKAALGEAGTMVSGKL